MFPLAAIAIVASGEHKTVRRWGAVGPACSGSIASVHPAGTTTSAENLCTYFAHTADSGHTVVT